ncbi:MAG TPA: lipoxygenase family protein [Candidatus Binataceae bacterium]|nr:lipoxygenase family protein [Candidatus Binataceae bacterium]
MANPAEPGYPPGPHVPWAPRGDLDPMKYEAWKASIAQDYYNHYFYQGVIPLAVNPPDDRDDGGIYSYSVRRNANVDFAKFLADFLRWKGDLFDAFTDFFFLLPTPLGAIQELYKDDAQFALFFLSGPDPTTLELVTDDNQLPPPLSFKQPGGRKVQTRTRVPLDFDKALAEHRIFHVDLSKYSHVVSPPRFASWPHAVFISVEGTDSFGRKENRLLPIAIADKASGTCAFPNSSATEWEFAKRAMLTAAANYHELGTHLSRCHMTMERYALATYRNLPAWHPVGRLLRPHFKFMVATNNDAIKNLINPGGPVDSNFAAVIDTLVKVTVDAFSTWDLGTHGGLEADLARRGLAGDDCKLPFWPYKEYGLNVYGAIRNFVRSYLSLWYPPDGAIYRDDIALQTWRRALREEYRAPSLMGDDASLEDLVTACTNIIWTSGPQHSAVNYTQYDFLGEAKILPFCIQLAGQKQKFEPTHQQIGDQGAVISRLSLYRWDQLGNYSTEDFLTEYGDLGDPNKPWRLAVAGFQKELKGLPIPAPETRKGLWDYTFLSPPNITNGISI